jgi:lipopolysaccharide export system permease protein
MTTLSRYILSQTSRPMAATILIALLALLAERSLRVVDMVIGWRGSLFAIFELLSYLVPHYMGLALPAAFFLGTFIATARMAREGELDAMQAGGAGLWRYTRPLVGAALLLAFLHLLLVGYIQPYSRYAYRAAVFAVTNVSFQTLLEPGVFTTLGHTTYHVRTLDAAKERFEDLFLYSELESGDVIIVTARRGRIEMQGPTQPVLLELEDGIQQIVPAPLSRQQVEGLPRALTLRFRNFTTDLRGSEPIGFRPRGEDERELTLDELWRLQHRPPAHIETEEIVAELHGRLARSLSIPVLPFLTVPLAMGRRRGRRSYGFVVGVLVLVGFHQILQTGEGLADNGVVDTWPVIWLPTAVFALLSLLLFIRRATVVPDPARGAVLDRLIEALEERLERFYRERISS